MNISGDIFDEILSRLPVKSLLRFKVVCKDWYFHIRSDDFIAKHMKNQATNEKILTYPLYDHQHRLIDDSDNSKFVVSICSVKEEDDDDDDDDSRTLFHQDQQYHIKDISLDYLRNYEDNNEDVKNFLELHRSLQRPYQALMGMEPRAYLVATCNGLVCLHWAWYTGKRNIIILWNPATRDFKALPSPQVLKGNDRLMQGDIGFGFDSTSNDYKVLLFLRPPEYATVKVMIYSLNTNSWRKLDYFNVPIVPAFRICGCSISLPENVYWVKLSFDFPRNKNQKPNLALLSFDMVKEVFQSTPYPLSIRSDLKYESKTPTLFTLHKSIALAYNGMRLEIWTTKVLNQGGESWIKVLNISQPSGIVRSLGYWKCKNSNDSIFLFSHYSGSYRSEYLMKGIYVNDRDEIKNGKMMTIKFKNNVLQALKVHTYLETLVPVNRS